MDINLFKENYYEFVRTLEDFERVKTKDHPEGETRRIEINVYKPKVMRELPEAIYNCFKGKELTGTCSTICFNASYIVFNSSSIDKKTGKRMKVLNIYVNSILRRPYTDNQRKEYERGADLYFEDMKLRYIYDSANDFMNSGRKRMVPRLLFFCNRCGGVYKATSMDFLGIDASFDFRLCQTIKDAVKNNERIGVEYIEAEEVGTMDDLYEEYSKTAPACVCVISPLKIYKRDDDGRD